MYGVLCGEAEGYLALARTVAARAVRGIRGVGGALRTQGQAVGGIGRVEGALSGRWSQTSRGLIDIKIVATRSLLRRLWRIIIHGSYSDGTAVFANVGVDVDGAVAVAIAVARLDCWSVHEP